MQTQINMMESIFRAISYGSEEARVFIPYILQLPSLKNNAFTKEFNEKLNMVPEWMFISYISQILSNFDFQYECYLDELVHKMAKKYPNALYYPFRLSQDNFHHIHEDREIKKPLINEINALLVNPIVDRFTSALQLLVIPEKMLSVHYQNFLHKTLAIKTNEKFQAALKELYDNVFVINSDLKGSEFAKIRTVFRDLILQMKKLNYETERAAVVAHINKIHDKIQIEARGNIKDIEIRKLCNWLSEYKWSGDADFIEIPGQYTGNCKPFIENHIKIVRFEQRLRVFSSKQLPIEVKMHGSDGKTYSFVIKYGEDLRQDQRIQQILKLMSSKLSLDKNCKNNRLKIDTYEVVPINSICGMLQIVSNSLTIYDFMQEISKKFMKVEFSVGISAIRSKFRNFLIGNGRFTNWVKTYQNAILNFDRQLLIDKFRECESEIPNDIIQRSLKNLSLTLNSYYMLRKNFITSLASMNIAHWLLGIGDRHLSNILMDMKNGRLIGIDFGIAFGLGPTLGKSFNQFKLQHIKLTILKFHSRT